MRTKYLKCLYAKGMFDDEYLVHFNSGNQSWCLVNREDIIKIDWQKGYVKCHPYAKEGEEICVLINDVGDHRLSPFRVKEIDLVSKAKAA